jgi:DNA-binding response OmpR family regulator
VTEEMNRILVVDDEPSVCEALAIGLASHIMAVDVTTNGESAVQLGCTGKYAVLIADLGLPDMNGIDVIKRIKNRYPEMIFILITADPTEETRSDARQNGVAHYIEKPFTLGAIKAVVTQALAECRSV